MNTQQRCIGEAQSESQIAGLGSLLKTIKSEGPNVGDVFQLTLLNGQYRAWKVIGIYLGALNQESIIALKPLDRSLSDYEIHVPRDMFNLVSNLNRV